MKLNKSPDRIIEFENETYLYFGGTSYLGLPTHSEFKEILVKNILRWGTAYGSSRNANIQLNAYENGERFLAKFIESESALTVSSGSLAGKLVIDTLTKENQTFFQFPNCHPAISAKKSTPLFIQNKLNPILFNGISEKITILTDAVPSMNLFPVDCSILNSIPPQKEITLVVDESHSLGILGKHGQGIFSTLQLSNCKRKIMLASLGKAFGLTGGVIAGDTNFIAQLKNQDSFVTAAGMNAAFVQTLADSEAIYIVQHKKLKENLNYLKNNLKPNQSFDFNPEYPLIYPNKKELNVALKKNKIIITDFDYPTGTKSLNRIVITANHTTEDLDRLIAVLNQ
jgi:7-keto-8-aminopelargonate synthetase-like enzyme